MQQDNQLLLPLLLKDQYRFNNYWEQDNQRLFAALQNPIKLCDVGMLYSYGISGSGKSHLMFAALHHAAQKNIRISYVNCAKQKIDSSLVPQVPFSGLFVLDNAQHISEEKEQEQCLLLLYEQIKASGGCLLLSANKPIEQVGFLLADIVSRLQSGLCFSLTPLNDTSRRLALELRAQCQGMRISQSTITYFLEHGSRDNHQLFALFDKIDTAALVRGRRITIPFVQQMMR